MFSVLKLARVRGAAIACLAAVMLMMACYVVPQVYLAYLVSADRGAGEVLQGIWLYLLLSFLAYPLSYAAYMLLVFWKTGARRAFYENAFAQTAGRVAQAANRDGEKKFGALISANGQEIVSDSVDFVHAVAGLLFSSVLSVALISTFVMGEFAAAYGVTVALSALLIWRLGKWPANTATFFEKAYNQFIAALPEGWLANTLGESMVMSRFLRLFGRRWSLYRRAALSAMNANQGFNLLQAVCIWVPTTAVILWRSPSMSTTEVIALAVVMPQLVQTLLEVSHLLQNVTWYLSIRGRVSWLNEALVEEKADLGQRFDAGLLRFSQMREHAWDDVPMAGFDDIVSLTREPGRYAIAGPNGSGKTSLLLHLKELLKERAFYLPAQSFLFPAVKTGLSTGQRKLRDLRSALDAARGRVSVILLDEWDANLDPANRERISAEIDELARRHAVVEVSHRARPSSPTS
jgi:ABC-type multidrug transport system fused ATPase/permease subunit